jgi:hypothetical protein
VYWIIAECGLVNLANISVIRVCNPEVEVNGKHRVTAWFSESVVTLFTHKERQKCVDFQTDLFLKLKEIRDNTFTRSE